MPEKIGSCTLEKKWKNISHMVQCGDFLMCASRFNISMLYSFQFIYSIYMKTRGILLSGNRSLIHIQDWLLYAVYLSLVKKKKKKTFKNEASLYQSPPKMFYFPVVSESISKGYISVSVVHDVWTMVCVAKCQRHFYQSLFLQGPLSPWHLPSWWRKERAQQPMKPQSPRFLLPTITLRPSQNQSSLGPRYSTPL